VRITDLHVARFGAFRDLRVDKLDAGLTVFCGPNEAGKTTLLQFIRAMLFGWDPWRQHYLPQADQPCGGTLTAIGHKRRFLLRRLTGAGQLPEGELAVRDAEGRELGPEFLVEALGGVDEAIYNNVFAVGLRELQELGTLDESGAATWLYSLSAGLDRVSLVEVMRELAASRNRILAPDGRPSLLGHLLGQRERLLAECQQHEQTTERWAKLIAERRSLDARIAAAEAEIGQLQRRLHVADVALAVEQAWRGRERLQGELDGLPQGSEDAERVALRFEETSESIKKGRRRRTRLLERIGELDRQIQQIPLNEALLQQAPRIEVLSEQRGWVETLQRQVQQLRGEISELENRWQQSGNGQLPHDRQDAATVDVPVGALKQLRQPARDLRAAERRAAEAEAEVTASVETAEALEAEIIEHLAAIDQEHLDTALEEAGSRIAQLRRRIDLDQRIEQMAAEQEELEDLSTRSLHGKLLPLKSLAALGIVFSLGAVLILVGLVPGLFSIGYLGNAGWGLALIGALGCVGVIGFKLFAERGAARKLDSYHRQHDLLRRQIAQSKKEREELDRQMPPGSGPLEMRLKQAEQDLADLQQLLPLQTRRQASLQEAAAARHRLAPLEQEHRAAAKAWSDALHRLRLSPDLTPGQLKLIARQGRDAAEVRRQLSRRREDLAQRQQELQAIEDRVDRLTATIGAPGQAKLTTERIEDLVDALRRHEQQMARRRALEDEKRNLQPELDKCKARLRRLMRRRRILLRRAECDSEPELRRWAAQLARRDDLFAQRETLSREIELAASGRAEEAELVDCLQQYSGARLRQYREQLAAGLQELTQACKRDVQRSGQLAQQQQNMESDTTAAQTRMELSAVEVKLDEARTDWQIRAVTSFLMDRLRQDFELNRQPETLREASGYLQRLTGDHFHRVWTPLGEPVLYVEDSGGQQWNVEHLSRGTREQLFLALRLALVTHYARRGTRLPLVLDDVLVNFDEVRAAAACRLLRDFAAAGNQVLIFTCHQHIGEMFQSLEADVRSLPGRYVDQVVSRSEAAPPEAEEVEPETDPEEPEEEIEVAEPAEADIEEEPIDDESDVEYEYEYAYEEVPYSESSQGDGVMEQHEPPIAEVLEDPEPEVAEVLEVDEVDETAEVEEVSEDELEQEPEEAEPAADEAEDVDDELDQFDAWWEEDEPAEDLVAQVEPPPAPEPQQPPTPPVPPAEPRTSQDRLGARGWEVEFEPEWRDWPHYDGPHYDDDDTAAA